VSPYNELSESEDTPKSVVIVVALVLALVLIVVVVVIILLIIIVAIILVALLIVYIRSSCFINDWVLRHRLLLLSFACALGVVNNARPH